MGVVDERARLYEVVAAEWVYDVTVWLSAGEVGYM